MDAAKKQVLFPTFVHRLIQFTLRPRSHLLVDIAFKEVAIVLPVNSSSRYRSFQIHLFEQNIADHLRHRRKYPQAPGSPERQPRPNGFEPDGGRHVRNRALTGPDRIRMTGLALHIRNIVVHHDSVAVDHHSAPKEMPDGLAHRDDRAFVVDYDKMRRPSSGRRSVLPGRLRSRTIDASTIRAGVGGARLIRPGLVDSRCLRTWGVQPLG